MTGNKKGMKFYFILSIVEGENGIKYLGCIKTMDQLDHVSKFL